MLIYQSEGFWGVDDDVVSALFRSVKQIIVKDESEEVFEVESFLCLHSNEEAQFCHVGFYCRNLKRTLIFLVEANPGMDLLGSGRQELEKIGFQLEKVNLNLSSAMRQVVLRNIPGILSSQVALKQKQEKSEQLDEWKRTFEADPQSVAGKKAKQKLDAEQRLDNQITSLRKALEVLLAHEVIEASATQDMDEQANEQVKEVEQLRKLVDQESSVRKEIETSLVADEKRIQELEALQMKTDPKFLEELNPKHKVLLETRIVELEKELESARSGNSKSGGFRSTGEQPDEKNELLKAELAKAIESKESQDSLLYELQENYKRIEERLKDAEEELQVSQVGAMELKDLEEHLDAKNKEIARTSSQLQEIKNTNQDLTAELNQARKECCELKSELKDTKKSLADMESAEHQRQELQRGIAQLNEDLEKARSELDAERDTRKRLERDSQNDKKRLHSLNKELAEEKKVVDKLKEEKLHDRSEHEAAMKQTLATLEKEIETREHLELDLQETHSMMEALEQALRKSQESVKSAVDKALDKHKEEVEILNKKQNTLELQLEREMLEQKKSVAAQAIAEKKMAELRTELAQVRNDILIQPVETGQKTKTKSKSSAPKPLPHEVRAAPKKGARFHPDWDLTGLPCRSAEQIEAAWESTFNVQLSLEGYPSQYCSAFLVVLKEDGQKSLYMVFRLTKNKHTLVCRPTSEVKGSNSFEEILKEGQKYLRLSGFDLVKLQKENIPGALGDYFCNI